MFFKQLKANMQTKTGAALTIGLLGAAGILVIVAVSPAPNVLKASVLAWVVAP